MGSLEAQMKSKRGCSKTSARGLRGISGLSCTLFLRMNQKRFPTIGMSVEIQSGTARVFVFD
jgi:hypothetical protein